MALEKQATKVKIIRYTVETWGIAQGKKYDTLLNSAIESLCLNPEKGRDINLIFKNARKWHVGRHLIIYRSTSKGIYVLRILHEKMDLRRHVEDFGDQDT